MSTLHFPLKLFLLSLMMMYTSLAYKLMKSAPSVTTASVQTILKGCSVLPDRRGLRLSSSSASSSETSSSSLRVTTYNVLSSHLGGANYYTNCKPEYLDSKYRLDLLKSKLQSEFDAKSIICLQEVSTSWAGSLHSYFSENGYYFITGMYGNKFNNYMGVGVAYPMDKFTLVDSDITRIADTKRIKYVKKNKLQQFLSKLKKTVGSIGSIWGKGGKRKAELWDNVTYRANQMVSLRLKFKENGSKPFVVGTYHMPCMFDLPSVMVAHCALSGQHIQKYANGDAHIFCGDFNIKPDSSMYSLLTTGSLDEEHPDYPTPPPGDSWTPTVNAFKSAYNEVNGREPDFTNYAKVKDEPAFIDTLDYIFHSKEWTVATVDSLPHRDAITDGPLPNESESSDHISISANISLQ